jgi:nucleotide-binding universal stress UspA family protein
MITTPDDHRRPADAMRVLLAVHGGEASGWGLEARRILATWNAPSVRVLAVVDVPRRSFRSLLPAAARRYRDALEAWVESERLRRLVEGLLPMLPGVPEVAWVRAAHGDPGRTIADSAATWSADVVLIGAAAPGLWLSAVHERLIRHASCPVLVTPVALVRGRRARVPSLTLTRARRRLGLLAGQEA